MDNLHILVVDDNHINRLFFESALKKLSCSVVCAVNGYEALTLAQNQSFDMILMDIRMDGMDGIETTKQIKLLDSNQSTPVIAVSAESFTIEQHTDFSACLLKPVNQQSLAELLSRFTHKTQDFNHLKALEISHHDEDIVLHLRDLFIEQLAEFKPKITALFEQQEFELLHEKLHQLLGSAKICAAENVITNIEQFKKQLKDSEFEQIKSLEKLVQAIEQAQKFK